MSICTCYLLKKASCFYSNTLKKINYFLFVDAVINTTKIRTHYYEICVRSNLTNLTFTVELELIKKNFIVLSTFWTVGFASIFFIFLRKK
jgi:hypothetical protein